MKRFFVSLLTGLMIVSQAWAYSPFDIVLRNAADLAVSDIYQDISSKDMYVKVCNVWGDMTEAGSLAVGIKKSGGNTITDVINGVTMNAGACRDFRVGSASGLGIVGTESAQFTAAIKITKSKKETNLANNKMIRYLSVTSAGSNYPTGNTSPWTPWTPTYPNNPIYPSYGTPDFVVQNIRYASSVSAYRDMNLTNVYNAFAVDVCNNGDNVNFSRNFQVTFSVNGHTETQTLQPYYNSSVTWNQGQCRTFAVEASNFSLSNSNNWYLVRVEANVGYDRIQEYNTGNNALQTSVWTDSRGGGTTGSFSVRITAPNGGETYSTNTSYQIPVRADITDYNRIDWVDLEVYRRNGYNGWNESLYTTERINGPFSVLGNSMYQVEKNLSIINWPEDDYRIKLIAHDIYGNSASDWTDSTFRVQNTGKPDLVIRSIYQQDYENRIVAQICNEGSSMGQTASFTNEFSVSSGFKIASKHASLRLDKDQCTTDITVLPDDLGIMANGYYNVTVRVDTENTIDERDHGNNTRTSYIYLKSWDGSSSQTDLTIESIRQDDNSSDVIARICNRWGNMQSSPYVSLKWQNITNYQQYSQYLTLNLGANQCTDTRASLWNLGINQGGYVTIQAMIDSDNQISEYNESNNTLSQSIFIRR